MNPGPFGRCFWWVAIVMLGGMACAQVTSVSRETQTLDESFQLVTGYAHIRNGAYTLGLEHPPLVKLLFGLAVRDLNPQLPAAFPSTPRDSASPELGTAFLYRNRVPADRLLMRGRLVAIAISLLFGFVIAWVTGRWFGRGAAILALALYILDPNFLAHGRYIKNDVAAALGIFAATAAWSAYLVSRKRAHLLLAGVLLGAALSTKFSALVLLPILLLYALVRRWQVPFEWPGGKIAASFAAALAIAYMVIWAVYGFEIGTPASAGILEKAAKFEPLRKFAASGPVQSLANSFPLPAPLFFRGIVAIGHMNMVGRETYLLGSTYPFPNWYYSPVVLAVKTPASIIGLFAAASILLWRRRPRGASLRSLPFPWIAVLATPLLYVAITGVIHINSGVRSLLPAYPFVFIFIAAAFVRLGARVILAIGLLALVAESALIYPHYLSFFNILAGGPARGPRYLLDSNLDWGQDLKYLKSYTQSHRVLSLCLSYYGLADVGYYGISYRDIPAGSSLAELDHAGCTVAVSATNLYSLPGVFEDLRGLEPATRIGNTIYVYDLHKRISRPN